MILLLQSTIAVIKPITVAIKKLKSTSHTVTQIWQNKSPVLNKLIVVFKTLLGDDDKKVLIRASLAKASQIIRNINTIAIWKEATIIFSFLILLKNFLCSSL